MGFEERKEEYEKQVKLKNEVTFHYHIFAS